MTTITVKVSCYSRSEGVRIDVEIDLICDYCTITANPDSRESLFVESAVMKVNGVAVPHQLSQATLDGMLAECQAELQDLADENLAIQQRWAA
jgi:hypothetical protein